MPLLGIERWISQHVALSLYGLCHPSCIANELARDGSVLKFVGSEPALGVCRQDIRRRIRHWLINHYWIWWRGLGDTQRRARELILGPCLGAKARFMSFNRTQSRAVTDLLTYSMEQSPS